MPRSTTVILLLLASVPAQTFVVDASGGAGAHFTSLQIAADTVPEGSTLLVQPGQYSLSATAKSLTILGQPGSVIADYLAVNFLPPNKYFVLKGFDITPEWFGFGPCWINNCQGRVVLEDLGSNGSPGGSGANLFGIPERTLRVMSSTAVYIRNSVVLNGILQDSVVSVENSSLTGTPANPMNGAGNAPIPAVSGLVLYGGEVQLAKAVVTPGSSLLPAILAQPGSGSNAPAPSVRVLEGTILGGAISAPAIVRNSASMPTVTATSTQPGGSIMAEVRQPTGTLCILLVGLPGLPVKFPGIVDAFWLDPAEYEFAELGTPQPNMPLTHSIAVPNLAGLQSFLAGWQAVSLDPVELQASNPSVSLIY